MSLQLQTHIHTETEWQLALPLTEHATRRKKFKPKYCHRNAIQMNIEIRFTDLRDLTQLSTKGRKEGK